MTSLWIFIALLLVLALAIVWRHFFKTKLFSGNQDNMRGQTNKDLYHEHLQELEKDLEEGGIDEENFGYLKEELDRSLLIDMAATEKEQQAKDKRTSMFWPATVSVFIIAFSAVLYAKLGHYENLHMAQQAMPAGHPDTGDKGMSDRAQQMIARMQTLQQEVKSNPENSQAWYELGQMLASIGEYDSAFVAYGKVNEIEGTQSDILALQAQAKFYQSGERVTDEVQTLLDKSLAIDPHEPSSLMLIGMDHFMQNRFMKAAETWQKILDANRGGDNSQALESAIQQAKNRAAMANHPPMPENGQASQPPVRAPQAAEQKGPKLSLNVTISDELIAKLNDGPDQTVFIYAIPAGGARMPLAAVRVRASDLPLQVTLDDSTAMRPEFALSSVDNVNVLAVISFAGKPGVQKGDFKAEIENVSVNHKEMLNLTIDTIVQ